MINLSNIDYEKIREGIIFEPPIVAVDFDGTICQKRYPEIGKPLPGVVVALNDIMDAGWDIIIWTCRTDHSPVRKYLEKYSIPYDFINENVPGFEKYDFDDSRKVGADFYVDDKVPLYEVNWPVLRRFFLRVYNKNNEEVV